MKRSYAVILICICLLLCVLTACISREDADRQDSPQVSVSAEYCTVTFYQDGKIIQQLAVKAGEKITQVPEGDLWQDASGQTVDLATLTVTGDMDLYAREQVSVQSEHIRYMSAENNMFRPNDPVTRGQAAQIICTIVNQEGFDPGGVQTFTDVPAGDAAYASVEEAVSLGLMNGYGDGTFRPGEPITRGEMVAVLCRMMGVAQIEALAFSDVTQEHWTMGSVAAAMAKGWLSGYEDGAFYPDAPLTRAEAVVLINRAIGKTPNKTAIDLVCTTSPYRDVSKKYWAYYDIVDESYSNALLAYIMGDVADAQQGFILLGDDMCHINGEKKLDYFQKGFHTISDGLKTDGLYYAPADGYFLQRNTRGLKELDGSMFFVARQDGPFITDGWYGYLYFGPNGRYTSGDTEVDGYVDAIMADIIQGRTESLLDESKLRQAYDYIINGGYDYMNRHTGWERGSVGWALECAKVMYESKRGSCYYWAASFLYLARRLGFQAYPVCGGVNENNALHAWIMINHGDVNDMIDSNKEAKKSESERQIDPDEYIYDVELDWAYRTGAHGRVPIRPGRNLFKQTRGHTIVTYIFPGDTWYAPPSAEDALGNSDENENGDSLYQDENGNQLTEGTDYTVTYTNNGDGTITVTITYLTGSRTGTSISYTIPDPDYGNPSESMPPEEWGGEGEGPSESSPPEGQQTEPPEGQQTEPPEGQETEPPEGQQTEPPEEEHTEPPEEEHTEPPAEEHTEPPADDDVDPGAV